MMVVCLLFCLAGIWYSLLHALSRLAGVTNVSLFCLLLALSSINIGGRDAAGVEWSEEWGSGLSYDPASKESRHIQMSRASLDNRQSDLMLLVQPYQLSGTIFQLQSLKQTVCRHSVVVDSRLICLLLLLKTVVNCNVASASVSLHTFIFMALYKFVFNFNFRCDMISQGR